MGAYAVGAFALVALLSALNGFESAIFKVYENYYPDLKVTPVHGKVFTWDSTNHKPLFKVEGVEEVCSILEDNAVISHGETQAVGLIKGVEASYTRVVNTDSFLIAGGGNFVVNGMQAWLAEGLFYKLNLGSENRTMDVMAPSRESAGVSQMDMLQEEFTATGVIRPGDELDQKLVIVGLEKARELFDRHGEVSALEIRLAKNANTDDVRGKIEKALGRSFDVKDRRMQNTAMYKMFNTEKWVAFAILSFVVLIISFNLIGSLTMLVIEKRKDIDVLYAMGGSSHMIKRIFFSEGLIISMTGALLGIILGVSAVWAQMRYGFIQTHATFTSAYPVELRVTDIFLVFGLCFAVGLSVSVYPAMKSTGTY